MTTCVSGLRCGIYISMIFMSESIILILIFFFLVFEAVLLLFYTVLAYIVCF